MDISVYIDGVPRTFRGVVRFEYNEKHETLLEVEDIRGRMIRCIGHDINGILQLDEKKPEEKNDDTISQG